MTVTTSADLLPDCTGVSDVLGQIGDKWTIQIIVVLREQPRRFNDVKRHVPGISQQMLTRTLKALERDGMVSRTIHDTSPPQVEYALTPSGVSLSELLQPIAAWAIHNRQTIRESRRHYDLGKGAVA